MSLISKKYKKWVKKYNKINENTDEKSVHEMRIFLRKIMVINDIFRGKKRGKLKKLFQALGNLRNVQLQFLIIEKNGWEKELKEYLEYLGTMEKEKIERLKPQKLSCPQMKIVKNRIFFRVIKRNGKRLKKFKLEDFKEFHKFRIEFKKQRYVLEVLSYLDKNKKIDLDRLKNIQNILGDLQDKEVFIAGLKEFYKNSEKSSIIKKIEKEKKEKMMFFIKNRKKLLKKL